METTSYGFTEQELRGITELLENLNDLERSNSAVRVGDVPIKLRDPDCEDVVFVEHGEIARSEDGTELIFCPAIR